MSVTLITTSFLNSAFYIASTGDELWLLPGIVISNNYDPAVTLTGAGSALISDGTILARIAGPGLSMTGADTSLVFGVTSIYRSAAFVGSPSILSSAGTASVTNHGLISTAKGTAMGLLGGGNSIYNDGTIEGGSGGVFVGINGGVGDRLVNYGTITAGNAQLAAFSERFNHAVQIEGSGSVLINHGTLAAVAAFGSGVNIGSFNFTGAGSRVENYGAITSALWWGVDMVTLTNGGATLYNHGLITGGTGGVRGSAFDDVVTNSGTVQGSIILNTGNDRYDGRGGVVFGKIIGGDGNDTLIGGAQDDDMDGGLGNDTVRGGAGDDTMTGFSNNDTMFGGTGDDTIIGGFGRDMLKGGAGSDVFVFATAADIGNTTTTRDQIGDFTTKQDVLDFGALPGTLIYIGAGVFSNVAGQLRCTAATGLLQGDTNGDSIADFTLALAPATVLAAGDLIL